MRRILCALAIAALLATSARLAHAQADIEVTTPDGRRALLKSDGTWRYADEAAKEVADDKTSNDEKAATGEKASTGEIVLSLERKADRGFNCRFEMKMTNNQTDEIHNLVLYYSAYRTNGVMYDSVSSESGTMKPGNARMREVEFVGIPCQDISRLQVGGGDHCEMGELHKFSEKKGECLARVRVVPSDLIRFDK